MLFKNPPSYHLMKFELIGLIINMNLNWENIWLTKGSSSKKVVILHTENERSGHLLTTADWSRNRWSPVAVTSSFWFGRSSHHPWTIIIWRTFKHYWIFYNRMQDQTQLFAIDIIYQFNVPMKRERLITERNNDLWTEPRVLLIWGSFAKAVELVDLSDP